MFTVVSQSIHLKNLSSVFSDVIITMKSSIERDGLVGTPNLLNHNFSFAIFSFLASYSAFAAALKGPLTFSCSPLYQR